MSHLSRYPFRNPQHFLQAALSHPSELYTVLQDLWTNATPPLSPTSKNLLHHIAAQIPQTQDSASQLLRRLHIVSAQQIQALLREETDWETIGSGEVKDDDDDDTGEYRNGADEEGVRKTKYPNDDDDDSSEYKPDAEDEDTREYCFCHTLSYGEMVGCENDQCPYEWFHLECVGLKEPPSESVVWYCPECRMEPGIAMKMK